MKIIKRILVTLLKTGLQILLFKWIYQSYKMQSGLYYLKRRKFLIQENQQVYINIHTDKFTEVIGDSFKH